SAARSFAGAAGFRATARASVPSCLASASRRAGGVWGEAASESSVAPGVLCAMRALVTLSRPALGRPAELQASPSIHRAADPLPPPVTQASRGGAGGWFPAPCLTASLPLGPVPSPSAGSIRAGRCFLCAERCPALRQRGSIDQGESS